MPNRSVISLAFVLLIQLYIYKTVGVYFDPIGVNIYWPLLPLPLFLCVIRIYLYVDRRIEKSKQNSNSSNVEGDYGLQKHFAFLTAFFLSAHHILITLRDGERNVWSDREKKNSAKNRSITV